VEAGVVGKQSFTTLQSVVAFVAGLSSIVGAAYSAVGMLRPTTPPTGQIIAVVRDASSAEPVPAAVVEVLTPDHTLVTSLPSTDGGVARGNVAPGAYRVRVLHPDFVEMERDVQIAPDATAQLRVALVHRPRKAAPRSAPARTGDPIADGAAAAVDRGVATGRRILGRFGF
jgi:hypothetical protein